MKVMLNFWKFRLWQLKEVFEHQESWYDGFSTFSIGHDGLIIKHVADKVRKKLENYIYSCLTPFSCRSCPMMTK